MIAVSDTAMAIGRASVPCSYPCMARSVTLSQLGIFEAKTRQSCLGKSMACMLQLPWVRSYEIERDIHLFTIMS